MQRFWHFVFLWLPPVLWMGLIFFLSAQPGLKIAEGPLDFWTRKSAHVFEYAVLFLLLYRALRRSFHWRSFNLYLFAGILSFLYAAGDELHQLFVPLRSGRLLDVGIDLLGVLAGILFLLLRWRFS